jgi:hypothetical protein
MATDFQRSFPMLRKTTIAIGLLAGIVICERIYYFSSERQSCMPASAGPLVCPDAHWDLGTINVTNGIVLEHEFVLRNASASPVSIGTPRTSCGCVTVTPPPAVLAPFATCQLKARISIIPSVKSIDQEIIVPIEHSQDRLAIAINGEGFVGPAVVSFPSRLSFGELAPGQYARRVVHLASNTGRPVHIKSLSSSDSRLHLERIPDDKSQPAIALSLSAAPLMASPTNFEGYVTVTFDDPDFDTLQVPFAASFRAADARFIDRIVVGKLKPGATVRCDLLREQSSPVKIESVTYHGDPALHVDYEAALGEPMIQVASSLMPKAPRRAAGILLVKEKTSNAVSCVPISAICEAP